MLNNIQRQTTNQPDQQHIEKNGKNEAHIQALLKAHNTYEEEIHHIFSIEANRQVQQRLKIVREVHAFLKAQQSFQHSNFYNRKFVYLVSTSWINKWKKYTKFDSISKRLPINWEWNLSSEVLGCINDDIVDKQQVSTLNINNFQHLTVFLKDSVVEERDFCYFSQEMWNIISRYKNIEVKREIKQDHGQKTVQIFPLKIELVMISNRILNNLKSQPSISLPRETIQFTRFSSVAYFQLTTSEAITQCLSHKYDNSLKQIDYESTHRRFLLIDPVFSLEKMKARIKKSLEAQEGMKEFTICLPTQELQYEMTFNNEVASTNPIIICEIIEKTQSKEINIFYDQKKIINGRCPKCKNYCKLQSVCRCWHITYCSDTCKNQDATHIKKCIAKKQIKNGDEIVRKRNGLVGLTNLGNTCFMNSGIQCISHIAELTQYFISNKYVSDINKDNPLGTKGNLSYSYGNVIQHLWCGHERTFAPSEFKKQVSTFQRMFSGYNQHDAGQFVTYVLEGLHEDLNKVKNKPYVQSKQIDERPESVIADEQWSNFLRRNNSKIVELMYGQYRSQVDCPKCKYKSCQFDPFMMCSLPIVDLSQRISITFQSDTQLSDQVIQLNFKRHDALAAVAQQIKLRKSLLPTAQILIYSSKTILKQQDQIAEAMSRYKTGICVRALSTHEDYNNGHKVIVSFKYLNRVGIGSQVQEQTYARRIFKFKSNLTCMQVHQYLYSINEKAYQVDRYEEILKKQPQSRDIALMIDNSDVGGLCPNCNLRCKGCYFPYTTQTIADYCHRRNPVQLKYVIRKSSQNSVGGPNGRHQWTSTSSVSLIDCFNAFEEPQTLTSDNAWYCPKCKQHVIARKQMMIYKAPKILILCLKRFKRKGMYTEKNQCLVSFPLKDLDLTNVIICRELPQNPNQHINQGSEKSETILYDLFAISNHIGNSGSGHYTATCKNPANNAWFLFDDSSVHEVSSQNIVSKSAYLLFYMRK